MPEAFTAVALRIHDGVFVRDGSWTPTNFGTLGITTVEAQSEEVNRELRVCRRGPGMFLESILDD
ncbi:MAG: hypothetical protein DMG54_20435 [Acidobacteria bacterium]|nr:MAG: hypothetical protein DMG54_20435 [Acidobacteriota bacterium]PYU70350.1 MAG: hypothetical protein DMG52_25825 [Acidobacteriota bacterium]